MQASIWNDCLKKHRTYRNKAECDWQKFDEQYIRFRAIYQVQQSLEGNLSNAVARNHAKADETVTSKNYSLQNDVPIQDSAKLFQNKHTYSLQKHVQS